MLAPAPTTALCHLGGGKRAEVEPTEPGAVGGGSPRAVPGAATRGRCRMRNARGDAGTGGFGGGQGAAGTRDKVPRTHTALERGMASLLHPYRHLFSKDFWRITTPGRAMNTSL